MLKELVQGEINLEDRLHYYNANIVVLNYQIKFMGSFLIIKVYIIFLLISRYLTKNYWKQYYMK